MAKKAVKKYFRLIILLFTIFMLVSTIYGLFGGDTNPASQGGVSQAMFCFALPLMLIVDLLLLIYWVFQKRWYIAALPLIAILSCIGYIGTFLRLGSGNPDDTSTGGLKVATYNVSRFGKEASSFIAQDIFTEMKSQHVDVVCFQEFKDESGDKKNSERFKDIYPYHAFGKSDMVIFSKYPIEASQTVEFEETNNSGLFADINVGGKKVRVFNVHMQTTGVNRTLHQASKLYATGEKVEHSAVLKAIYGNYMLDLMIRAGQANQVANEVRQSELPVILCGDFNDVPYSYVYKTLKGNLTDGFCEAGGGWMWTYRGKKALRIDYIFYDPTTFSGVSYYKNDNITYSDHVPVYCKVNF